MQSGTAKLVVVFGVGTAVVGTTVKEILDGQPGPTFYVPLAGALVAIPLLIATDFVPDIAGGLGLLILVAAWLYSGQAIMQAANNATNTKTKSPSDKGTPPKTPGTGGTFKMI